ncbi:carboxymuconolactone decarboxylase family protein [Mycobacterium sp. 1274756.6]|uniref:carboxymuconolactone decarboxylase family protein n=1 Tax=Mycobacterium sp. 1274756.6 TaxID=1834076 RepID=UPI0007FF2143|nr:hypothetical protein A5643_16145 [Mycobacterium sp. 1274756.6]
MEIHVELARLITLATGVDNTDPAVAEFTEQFGVDVSRITDEQRARLLDALGPDTFTTVVQMYLADFLPRIHAGLDALQIATPWRDAPATFDDSVDAATAVFDRFAPAVARLRALDPVTSELVRLRGAAAHNCRLCASLREGGALDAGGSETLYDEIERFETSTQITDTQKTALRYVDELVWSPGAVDPDVAADVRRHFSEEQALELTLDVMRNAMNKIAVAMGADAPRVTEGTERYLTGDDGRPVFG